jgi:3',5'-cyclic AMP phosphodiesterase CpdA
MTIIAHLSDLHFGRVDPDKVAPLIHAVQNSQPDLTVVSGDFVQSATKREFQQARDFVEQLPHPQLCVPGNHDMAFYNWFRRLVHGLRNYKEYITADLEPFWRKDNVAAMGVNTARRWPIRGGRINEEQIRSIERRLCSLGAEPTKILVTHHPFDLSETYGREELVGRARTAMGRLAQTVDILLAGHMHVSHAGRTAVRYRLQGRSAVFVQAGTAISTWGRGESNAFNLLRIDRPRLVIDRQQWDARTGRFHCACSDAFNLWVEPETCAMPSSPLPQEVQTEYSPK